MEKILMKKIMNYISGVASALACIVLVGCNGAANFAEGDNHLRNEVQMIKMPFMVTFKTGSADLSDEGAERLDIFMMKSNVSYSDELSMDFPLNRDGDLSVLNQKRLTFISSHLKKRGLRLSPEVTPYGMSPGSNEARFLISRYIVTPPVCGDWSIPSTDNDGNTSLSELGCSNQANLGLMVANPRDLITGDALGVPDTESAAKAIMVYRTKSPTKLSKNSKKSTRKSGK